MNVTYHAATRFLQRVMKKEEYNKSDVVKTKEYLQRVFKDVVVRRVTSSFALPGFENFRVVYKDNTAITIVPKD